jgi:hypothetical protein
MAQDEDADMPDVDLNEDLEHDIEAEDIEANTDNTPTDDNGDAKE